MYQQPDSHEKIINSLEIAYYQAILLPDEFNFLFPVGRSIDTDIEYNYI